MIVLLAGLALVLIYVANNLNNSSSGKSTSATVQDWAAAITQAEGVNPSHNNPGALSTAVAKGNGTSFGTTVGLANFDTPSQGQQALIDFLTNAVQNHPDWTLEQATAWYTGTKDTSSQSFKNYLSVVTDVTGASPTDTLGDTFNT